MNEASEEQQQGTDLEPASSSLSTVPPFLRVLLATDGTVTKSIEAYFWEPIEVNVLAHGHADSARPYPALKIAAGDSVLRRRVILRGKMTRTLYAFAESIMGRNGVATQLGRKLVAQKKGIGELLREDKLETYRELVSIRRTCADEWAAPLDVERSAAVLVRTYRIHHGGSALIQIEEVFPELRFARV